MQRQVDPRPRWLVRAGAAWLLLAAYVGLSSYLVGRYQPKIALDARGAAAVVQRDGRIGAALYEALAPVWQYNRFVIPALVGVAAGLSFMAWLQVRKSRGMAA
jgi:hypothetical protein